MSSIHLAIEAVQAAVAAHRSGIVAVLAVDPTPKGEINTTGILTMFATTVAPVLLAVLGLIFLGRAGKGNVSQVMTSGGIAIVGLAFLAGAAILPFVGSYLVDLVIH